MSTTPTTAYEQLLIGRLTDEQLLNLWNACMTEKNAEESAILPMSEANIQKLAGDREGALDSVCLQRSEAWIHRNFFEEVVSTNDFHKWIDETELSIWCVEHPDVAQSYGLDMSYLDGFIEKQIQALGNGWDEYLRKEYVKATGEHEAKMSSVARWIEESREGQKFARIVGLVLDRKTETLRSMEEHLDWVNQALSKNELIDVEQSNCLFCRQDEQSWVAATEIQQSESRGYDVALQKALMTNALRREKANKFQLGTVINAWASDGFWLYTAKVDTKKPYQSIQHQTRIQPIKILPVALNGFAAKKDAFNQEDLIMKMSLDPKSIRDEEDRANTAGLTYTDVVAESNTGIQARMTVNVLPRRGIYAHFVPQDENGVLDLSSTWAIQEAAQEVGMSLFSVEASNIIKANTPLMLCPLQGSGESLFISRYEGLTNVDFKNAFKDELKRVESTISLYKTWMNDDQEWESSIFAKEWEKNLPKTLLNDTKEDIGNAARHLIEASKTLIGLSHSCDIKEHTMRFIKHECDRLAVPLKAVMEEAKETAKSKSHSIDVKEALLIAGQYASNLITKDLERHLQVKGCVYPTLNFDMSVEVECHFDHPKAELAEALNLQPMTWGKLHPLTQKIFEDPYMAYIQTPRTAAIKQVSQGLHAVSRLFGMSDPEDLRDEDLKALLEKRCGTEKAEQILSTIQKEYSVAESPIKPSQKIHQRR